MLVPGRQRPRAVRRGPGRCGLVVRVAPQVWRRACASSRERCGGLGPLPRRRRVSCPRQRLRLQLGRLRGATSGRVAGVP